MRILRNAIAVTALTFVACSGPNQAAAPARPPTSGTEPAAPRAEAEPPRTCNGSALPASCDGEPALGHYGPTCYAVVASWLERRCDGGDVRCCGFLGEALQQGHLHLSAAPSRAASLMRRACDSGAMSEVCARLGVALLHGDGVSRDPAGALSAFQKGCDLGNGVSCLQLVVPYRDGSPELRVERDGARAAAFAQRACDLGSELGCGELGLMLVTGSGVPRDVARAVALLERACAARIARPCRNLGVVYRDGLGVPADPARAADLLRQACDSGDTAACEPALP